MKKIYQTIVDKDKGNCMQATIASLLELELEEVPNFISYPYNDEKGSPILWMWRNGYPNTTCIVSYAPKTKKLKSDLPLTMVTKFDGGIKGFFYASVPSQSFKGKTHAVVVDADLKVVHDPNPNQLALNCKPEDINYIFCVNDFYISKEGELIKGENYEEPNL